MCMLVEWQPIEALCGEPREVLCCSKGRGSRIHICWFFGVNGTVGETFATHFCELPEPPK